MSRDPHKSVYALASMLTPNGRRVRGGPGCDGFCLMFLSDAIRPIGRSPSLESTTQPMKVKRPCPRRIAQEELLWLDILALATPLTPVTTS